MNEDIEFSESDFIGENANTVDYLRLWVWVAIVFTCLFILAAICGSLNFIVQLIVT